MTVNKITPYKDVSWYIKWTASILILISIIIRAAGISVLLDMCLGFVGMSLWAYVGYLWHDRSLILLNAVASSVLAIGILKYLTI